MPQLMCLSPHALLCLFASTFAIIELSIWILRMSFGTLSYLYTAITAFAPKDRNNTRFCSNQTVRKSTTPALEEESLHAILGAGVAGFLVVLLSLRLFRSFLAFDLDGMLVVTMFVLWHCDATVLASSQPRLLCLAAHFIYDVGLLFCFLDDLIWATHKTDARLCHLSIVAVFFHLGLILTKLFTSSQTKPLPATFASSQPKLLPATFASSQPKLLPATSWTLRLRSSIAAILFDPLSFCSDRYSQLSCLFGAGKQIKTKPRRRRNGRVASTDSLKSKKALPSSGPRGYD